MNDTEGLTLETRDAPPRAVHALEQAGLPPLLARLYAGRGVRDPQDIDDGLAHLLPPALLRQADQAAALLAQTLQDGGRICVVADYDCDGATACAVALRGLALLGARAEQLDYVVPDRGVHGYGLTPTIVDLALQTARHGRPDVLLTVGFPSKNLAGVGVMFYVLMALRSELRQRGAFEGREQPRLDGLLDLVALGTVADVVKLDTNNRRLVAQGLRRIRSGRMQPGVAALFAVAGRDPATASAQDFGFALGPRINAAGRLSDMTLGIECLVTDDLERAQSLASSLDAINRERRVVEDGMREQAERLVAGVLARTPVTSALCLYDPGFHEGVVGIVAGRLKDRLHRPVFVFAQGQDGLLKGSGRSIEGFHLRDALDLVSKRHPQALVKFGGHAMAAGCTLLPDAFSAFESALREVADQWLDPAVLQRRLRTDGPLPPEHCTPDIARLLSAQVWGQGFEAPLFCDRVRVLSQRTVGERHLKLQVRPAESDRAPVREAIWFNRQQPVPDEVTLAYRLDLNQWQGREHVQWVVQGMAERPAARSPTA